MKTRYFRYFFSLMFLIFWKYRQVCMTVLLINCKNCMFIYLHCFRNYDLLLLPRLITKFNLWKSQYIYGKFDHFLSIFPNMLKIIIRFQKLSLFNRYWINKVMIGREFKCESLPKKVFTGIRKKKSYIILKLIFFFTSLKTYKYNDWNAS